MQPLNNPPLDKTNPVDRGRYYIAVVLWWVFIGGSVLSLALILWNGYLQAPLHGPIFMVFYVLIAQAFATFVWGFVTMAPLQYFCIREWRTGR